MRKLSELMDLTGRCALVTGGGGHVGGAAADALAELGARIAIVDQDEAACRRQVAELDRIRPGSAASIVADLANEAAARAAVQEALAVFGRLDVLVHAAAFVGTTQKEGWSVPFEDQTVAAWDAGMRVNLTSAFVLAQEAREALSQHGCGSMILLSSIYGFVGSDPAVYEESGMNADRVLAYSASKGGLLQLMRHLATLLAPAVRVNAISPGGIARAQPEPFRRRYAERTPLGRLASEEDLKGAVAYLASDLSAYVTGHNLVVDGGWTAW